MRTMTKIAALAAFLAALVLAVGCEDSPIAPGTDFTMTLVATPSTVDPAHDPAKNKSTIRATVLSDTGVPQKGITVYFSSDGGTLQSGSAGIETNASGIASDVLTVAVEDAEEIAVTATSGALTQTVTVTQTANHAPVATITASPASQQTVGNSVVFDGSTSDDQDPGDSITHYKWSITSSNPDNPAQNPIIREGASLSSVTFPSFTNVQTLTVVLTVTDETALAGVSAPLSYAIKARACSENLAPTARIVAGGTLIGAVGSHQTFFANGTLSSDAATGIGIYSWSCGNGAPPVVTPPGGNGSTVNCDYVVEATSHTYTLTLVVTDQGFGPPGFECPQVSAPVSVQVVVTP